MAMMMKLIPCQFDSISFVIEGGLHYIFRFVTFHIFERMSDNMDSIIVISDQLLLQLYRTSSRNQTNNKTW